MNEYDLTIALIVIFVAVGLWLGYNRKLKIDMF